MDNMLIYGSTANIQYAARFVRSSTVTMVTRIQHYSFSPRLIIIQMKNLPVVCAPTQIVSATSKTIFRKRI